MAVHSRSNPHTTLTLYATFMRSILAQSPCAPGVYGSQINSENPSYSQAQTAQA